MMRSQRSKGVSLVEIVLATALAAVFIFPMLGLMQSLQPAHIEKRFGILKPLMPETEARNLYDKFIETVSKDSGQMRSISILAEEFADMRGRNSCRDFNPAQATMQYVLPSEISFLPSDIPTQIDIIGDRLVMAVNSASSTDPDLLTFVLPEEGYIPVPQSSIDFGPGSIDMFIQGFTAYVANTSVLSQAKSIDLSKGALSVKNNFVIPGSNSTTTPIARKVIAYKNLVIAGTEKSTLPEIAIFDAATGVYVGYVDTGYGINALHAKEDMLIVLGPADPELEVFDLSPVLRATGPAAVPLTKTFEFDAVGGSGNGRSVDSIGNILLFGRSRGGEELQLLQMPFFRKHPWQFVDDRLNVIMLAEENINASVDAVILDAGFAFVFAFDQQRELQIFKLTHYGASAIDLQMVQDFDLPGRVAGAVCKGPNMYIAIKDPEYPLVVITSSP